MVIHNGIDQDAALVRSAARRLQYAARAVEGMSNQIAEVGRVVGAALRAGKKILVFGNGGSAACAQHFSAEFTGKLKMDRRPYPAISLTTDTSALTAIGNDYGYDFVFSRQVTAFADEGDIVVGLSTSGTSRNVVAAFEAAVESGAITIGLTGAVDRLGGAYTLSVPLRETARVQEAHDLILHELAQISERIAVPDLGWDSSASPFDFLLTPDDLPSYRDWIEETGQVLVTTNGVFDLLHSGHVHSIEQARALGDRLLVLVNDDASVRRLKGDGRPVRDAQMRIDDLRNLPAIDNVVLMSGDDPRELLADLRPHVHAKGKDYEGRVMVEAETVQAGGGEIAFLGLIEGISTTAQLTGEQK